MGSPGPCRGRAAGDGAVAKVRAQTSVAIPANWTSLTILPSGGVVSGAKDALTAIAY